MSLDLAFAALSDPTRRDLLSQLEAGEQTLSNLASPYTMSLMAIQKHVRVLEEADLVTTEKIGRSRHVRLKREGLEKATDWVKGTESRWNARFNALDRLLETEKKKAGKVVRKLE
jgi:DNA-binding transcriptional ArsR family regulator